MKIDELNGVSSETTPLRVKSVRRHLPIRSFVRVSYVLHCTLMHCWQYTLKRPPEDLEIKNTLSAGGTTTKYKIHAKNCSPMPITSINLPKESTSYYDFTILYQGYFFGVFWATEDSGLSETLSFWTNQALSFGKIVQFLAIFSYFPPKSIFESKITDFVYKIP